MEQTKLTTILDEHKKWLTTGGQEGNRVDLLYANLRYADLRDANLRYADLRGADLDFSCFSLWCGGLDVHIDDKQATQLLYHLIRNVKFSKNTSKALKQIFQTESLITQANKFHRVNECGTIEEGGEKNAKTGRNINFNSR